MVRLLTDRQKDEAKREINEYLLRLHEHLARGERNARQRQVMVERD